MFTSLSYDIYWEKLRRAKGFMRMEKQIFEEVNVINMDPGKQQDSIELFEKSNFILNSSNESYRLLLSALDLDWQVEEPVYLRPRWNQKSEWVYHFILKHRRMGSKKMITTRHNQEIERFVKKEGWEVEKSPGKKK